MCQSYLRTELLLGKNAMQKLRSSRVAVFGLGGVGGYAVEALARCGIGALDLVDSDRFEPTNLNRQLHATNKTLGRYKTDVVAERIAEIDPSIRVKKHRLFYLPETEASFSFHEYDYIIDAIDTVTAKLSLVTQAKIAGVPIISSMGTGNKLNPSALEVADIYQTSVCPLAKVMRHELKKRGIESLKVVYSKEPPLTPLAVPHEDKRRQPPGSVSFVPSVAGLILAGEAVKDLVRGFDKL